MVFHIHGQSPPRHQGGPTLEQRHASDELFPSPVFSSKLLSSFKLPKFDGLAKSWKGWKKSFQRFLGLHQLDYVLEEDFPSLLWVTPGAKAANKMVFYLVEDAVATGTLTSKLVRQATKWDGHGAFILLRNGYVYNGPQTATILLAELSKMRLRRDEDASAFCLRLVELIEDLELVPGDAAVYLTDTQKLGYLLSAIRHETGLQSVYIQLQSEQLRGTVSFDQACRELHHRVESMKADDLIDGRTGTGKALISTEGKKNGQQGVALEKVPCLAKDCKELIQPYLPLCKLCYLQSMAGKISVLVLRDNLGSAFFNTTTKLLDFPSTVPKSRFPKKNLRKGKALVGFLHPILCSLTTPLPEFSSTVAAGQDGEMVSVWGVPHHSLPVTAGQDGRVTGKTSGDDDGTTVTIPDTLSTSLEEDSTPETKDNIHERLQQMKLHHNLSEHFYVDSSYANPEHGFYATPFSVIHDFPTNEDRCPSKDLALTNPLTNPIVSPAPTALERVSRANPNACSGDPLAAIFRRPILFVCWLANFATRCFSILTPALDNAFARMTWPSLQYISTYKQVKNKRNEYKIVVTC
jgi:hypothetical protein